MYRALDIAHYVVQHALSKGLKITHLQLQKILYFLEARYLVKENRSLFKEDIEKWKLGPVVPEVYHEYKIFGSAPIEYVPKEAFINFESGLLEVTFREFNDNVLDENDKKEIGKIVENILSQYDGYELVKITHEHRLWEEDQYKINLGEKGIKYDKDDLKRYFQEEKRDELERVCYGNRS